MIKDYTNSLRLCTFSMLFLDSVTASCSFSFRAFFRAICSSNSLSSGSIFAVDETSSGTESHYSSVITEDKTASRRWHSQVNIVIHNRLENQANWHLISNTADISLHSTLQTMYGPSSLLNNWLLGLFPGRECD